MAADLHMHSIFSDGSKTPEELIEMAEKKRLKTISLTDHDTIAGIERALGCGKKRGVEVVPGIELSTLYDGFDVHILGYFIDFHSDLLLKEINKYFYSRIERAKRVVEKLNEMGVMISFADVKRESSKNFIGRPHIARAMLKAGYIDEMKEAFSNRYIAREGKAYVRKYQLSTVEGIRLITRTGGIPVLAHPYLINPEEPFGIREIRELKKQGLLGLEVYHSKHPAEIKDYYHRLADKLELLVTGGSDYHGDNSPEIEMGKPSIGDEYVEKIKENK